MEYSANKVESASEILRRSAKAKRVDYHDRVDVGIAVLPVDILFASTVSSDFWRRYRTFQMPSFTATRVQIATYLLGVCPFSIAFLVFLNSSVSFVVTDLIGQEGGVGDAVGNLGFADELVALVACPIWGLLSDRIGVRTVCVMGYAIIGLALVLFVQARNVYPQLLLGRLFFSIGGAAASTMVTAVLPSMSYVEETGASASQAASKNTNRHTQAPSIASILTITPARFQASSRNPGATSHASTVPVDHAASTAHIAGYVGMFTGFGALLALFVFLPLPASFQKHGVGPGPAVQYSYYIVAGVAVILSVACLFGLRFLKSEARKGWRYLLNDKPESTQGNSIRRTMISTVRALKQAFVAGLGNSDIGIGYLGGFVARASSVGISLFIPLLVNAMFTSSGLCSAHGLADTPAGLPDIKRRCPRAYIVAAELTGASQMVALLSAPIFGYWSARTSRKTLPLAFAAISGIIGYPLFATQFDPNDDNKSARAVAFVSVCFIGFSQIGAIVCSLASLGTGVLNDSSKHTNKSSTTTEQAHLDEEASEDGPLLGSTQNTQLSDLKGSVAGVYSFFGGAAILILTKAGGALFDSTSTSAPFLIMTIFNGILLVATIVVGISRARSAATA